jgi:hypothetical protein
MVYIRHVNVYIKKRGEKDENKESAKAAMEEDTEKRP